MLTDILAIIGAVGAIAALIMQWRDHVRDRHKLVVEAKLKKWATAEIREMHHNLTVILKNHGRRCVRVRSVDMIIFPESVTVGGHTLKVTDFRFHLYDSKKEGLLILEEGDRREIVHEPFTMLPPDGDIEAVIEVIDALDQRYHYTLNKRK
jgi:hypothetical protein